MKRIIKNNYQPNSVRTICKSVFEFDLEEEEFWVYRDGEVYVERQISCTRMLRVEGTYPYHIKEP